MAKIPEPRKPGDDEPDNGDWDERIPDPRVGHDKSMQIAKETEEKEKKGKNGEDDDKNGKDKKKK